MWYFVSMGSLMKVGEVALKLAEKTLRGVSALSFFFEKPAEVTWTFEDVEKERARHG